MSRDDRSIALLRGVNVGGKNRLPMKELATIFREAGCSDVQTYIQSGNVIYRATRTGSKSIPGTVSAMIADRFGMRIPIVTRTAEELARVAERNPFLASSDEVEDTRKLHVGFLLDWPEAERVEALDPDRSPPDEFAVEGRDIYLRLPNGSARSRLTAQYFDSRLQTVMTVRNWRTVLTLRDMAFK